MLQLLLSCQQKANGKQKKKKRNNKTRLKLNNSV